MDRREKTVNEVKMNVIVNNIENETASKVLFGILDTYLKTGEQFINVKLKFSTGERMYLLNLYNNPTMRDIVKITNVEK